MHDRKMLATDYLYDRRSTTVTQAFKESKQRAVYLRSVDEQMTGAGGKRGTTIASRHRESTMQLGVGERAESATGGGRRRSSVEARPLTGSSHRRRRRIDRDRLPTGRRKTGQSSTRRRRRLDPAGRRGAVRRLSRSVALCRDRTCRRHES